MKKLILLVAAVAIALSSCQKINDELANLGNRLDKLEQEAIPTIDEQIVAINLSLTSLDAMDKELKGYIDGLTATASSLQDQITATNTKIDEVKTALQGEISTAKTEVLEQLDTVKSELEGKLAQINATIETLQAKDAELEGKITDLKTYVDTELKSTTDWVNATFATLEQYNSLVSEVATIKEQIKAINQSIADLETRLTTKINEDIATAVSTLNADIQQKVSEITTAYTNAVKTAKEEITTAYTVAIQTAISNLDSSLKAWVGEQLANYYTIAEVNAKITALQNALTEGDTALQEELNKLKNQLETAASEITAAYKKAIEEAITTNNGVINTKIANEIATVNSRIDSEVTAINAKIAELQAQVNQNTEDIAKLLARIQSVSYIPTYSDGKATVKYAEGISQVTLDFEISPKDAVVELAKVWENAVSVKAVYTQTRAVSFIEMPIVNFEADATNGVITVTASGENLSEEFFAGTQEASCRLAISDGNNSVMSEYVQIVTKEVNINQLLVPFNQIWYTSDELVTPNKTDIDTFATTIISNKYNAKTGRGIITFDSPVTKIGEDAFYGSNLKSIILGNGITTIQRCAFESCAKLTSITIPNSVITIGKNAFYGCSSLTRVDITDLSAWCKIYFVEQTSASPLHNGAGLYLNGEKVSELTIPSDINTLNFGAFYGCTSLTNVTIPDSVTSIQKSAFCYCTSLTTVTIGNNVTSIKDYAFYKCTSLKRVNVNNLSTWCKIHFGEDYANPLRYGKLYIDGSIVSEIIIPSDITKIETQAFCPYSSLTSVTIPSNITSIGQSAFASCTTLTSLTISNGVVLIGGCAFYNCNRLTSVTIPDSVTTLGEGAFYGCDYLTSFYGKFASEDNRCLVVDGVLNSFAPAGLTQYSILDNIISIGVYSFRSCSKLTDVVIPNSVTSIGNSAFGGCTSLTSVYCKPTTPPTGGEYMFSYYESGYKPIGCKIYVPRNSVEAYKNAEYWSVYADYIEGYDF